jgi:endoglycosylceramidase
VPDPSIAGRWLVDRAGRVVLLHGTNMISKYAPYTYAALGFGARDLRFLRAEGLDAIRLGFIWEALEPRPGDYDDHYLNGILGMVHDAERSGLEVILDFHQDSFNEAWHGEGFPAWTFDPADARDPAPSYFGTGLAWQDFMNDRRAPDGVGIQEHLARAWAHVAARLRGDSHVILEPLNEPYPFAPADLAAGCLQPEGCPTSDESRLWPLYAKLLAGIRSVDRTRPVFMEPWFSFDYGVRSWLPRFADAQVGFAPHVYCITGGAGLLPTVPGSCPAQFSLGFKNIAFHNQQAGEPTLVTEWGAGGPYADHLAFADQADRAMVGWFHWAYWSQDGGQPQTYALLKDIHAGPVYGNVRLDQLDAITRPYPRLIAGTPRAWGYDPSTDLFTLRFATTRFAGGGFPLGTTTQVVLPSLHYPDGYAVTAAGAAILSPPRAPLLVLAACPDTPEVEVTVAPSGTSRGTCHPWLGLQAEPSHLRAGHPELVTLRVRAIFGSYRAPVADTLVRIGRTRRRTDSHGRLRLALRPGRSARRIRLLVSVPAYPVAQLSLTVAARPRSAAPPRRGTGVARKPRGGRAALR